MIISRNAQYVLKKQQEHIDANCATNQCICHAESQLAMKDMGRKLFALCVIKVNVFYLHWSGGDNNILILSTIVSFTRLVLSNCFVNM